MGICLFIWFYKDYQYQKSENIRQTENSRQLRISDSLKYTSQILNKEEIAEYLEYQNKDLKKLLDNNDIKLNRIQSIVSSTYRYKNDTVKSYDVSGIIDKIRNKIPTSMPFKDSTKCLVNKGFVKYENDSLKVIFTSREFTNKNDNVAYWERRQWKFLFIKSRFLGKKQFTAMSFDKCGETKTMKIEKKPKE